MKQYENEKEEHTLRRKRHDYIKSTKKIEKDYNRLKNILSEIQNIEKIYYIKYDRLFNK